MIDKSLFDNILFKKNCLKIYSKCFKAEKEHVFNATYILRTRSY